MDSIFVVMPAYNEQENIKTVVKKWYSVLEGKSSDSRLVVADSESTDNTHEILKKLQRSYPQLEILQHTQKQHGPKVLALYRYAIENRADYIFQTDSDGQTLPEEFGEFWKRRKKYDALIGYRNNREDGFSRIVVTKTLKLVLKIIFGLNVTDANTPYRLMSRRILKKYIHKVPEKFNLSNVMLTVLFLENKEKVKFIPITFRQRQGGVNSIHLPKIIKIGWQALKDFKKIKWEMRHR